MKRSPIVPPLMLAVVFVGPVLLAAIAYWGAADWLRQTAAPHGELIDPPMSMPALALATWSGESTSPDWFRYRWSLLYARGSRCETRCLEDLNRLGQVRLALGRDRDRVQLVFLLAEPTAAIQEHAELIVGRLDDAAGGTLVDVLGANRIREGRVYIVDPRGRIVMSYSPQAEQKGMLADLKRLLRVSKIG